jgi:hypothetical protein
MTDDMMPSAANGGIVAFADNPDQPVREGMPATKPYKEYDDDPTSPSYGQNINEKATSTIGRLVDSLGGKSISEWAEKTGTRIKDIEKGHEISPGLFEKLTPTQRANRLKEMESLLSNPKPSTYKTISKPEDKAALEEKIRATMGEKVMPQKSPAFADSDAAERADRMTGTLTAGGKKKGLNEALAVGQAAQNVAQNAGVEEQPLEDRAMSIYKKFKEMSSAELKGLNDAIEGKKGDADKIKAKGLSEALMQFGFGMAANAAKPGAKFIGSASAAAPILGQVASENEKLQRAASDNYMKLKMDQTRYQVALDKGDMQAATSLAAQIRQGNMQQKQLDAQIDHWNKQLQLERQKMGVTAAAYAPQSIREAEWLMANKDNPAAISAYEKSTRGKDAASLAAGARDRAALAKGLLDLNKQQKTEKMMYPPNTPEGKKMAIEHEMQKKLLHESLGFQYTGGAAPASSPIKVLN